ncbi:hypothetical protein AB1Y20_021219 [Prymnesium parvum]|uniref:Ankyrin repeat domain-containing protein n=1 Tax=Prymnesium parvum TaxID=97485 RepID=A0AB34JKX2_PRYPA
MGSFGHYPYPLDSDGKPIDTPEWRDACNIKKFANPSDSDLIKAVRFDDKDPGAVDAALAAGADINQKDKYGFTPLMLAIKAQNSKLIYKLLDVSGVDVNCKSNRGFTPLMIAAWKGDTGCASKLISMGADLKAVDSGGRNAWGVAHDWHKEEMLELFKRHGLEHKEGDRLSFPPAPKWREGQRDKVGN